MMLGSSRYIIKADSYSRLYKAILRENIPVRDMREEKGELRLKVSWEYSFRLRKVCKELGLELICESETGLPVLFRKIKKRPGLVVGGIAALMMWQFLGNRVLIIDIDTDNEELRSSVMTVLSDQGITPGIRLSDIDFTVTERRLRKEADGVAWAGISNKGSRLAIDIIEVIPAEKGIGVGLPCDLVACEDGEIKELRVMDGMVVRCVGSGVLKGDVVVSGTVVTEKSKWVNGKEEITRRVRYTRCLGAAYGEFTRVEEFFVPFEQETSFDTGETKKLSSIRYFDKEIPLFGSIPEGSYITERREKPLKLFGLTLPLSHSTFVLHETGRRAVTIGEEQAADLAKQQAELYEKNFLGEYELLSREDSLSADEKGVTLTVTYTLYGKMTKESYFFIPKNPPEKEDSSSEK